MMALSDFYESTIIEAKASFGFSNFACDPDTITGALGISPDEIMRKGQEFRSQSSKTAVAPFNSWSIYSRSTSKDVNVHLRELLERLGERYMLAKREWGNPEFGVTWKNLYAGTGPYYEADVLEGISKWKAELYQDIYQVDQDLDESNRDLGSRRLTREELRRILRSAGQDDE